MEPHLLSLGYARVQLGELLLWHAKPACSVLYVCTFRVEPLFPEFSLVGAHSLVTHGDSGVTLPIRKPGSAIDGQLPWGRQQSLTRPFQNPFNPKFDYFHNLHQIECIIL